MGKVKEPHHKVNMNVVNQSARTDSIKIMVKHTTEGPNSKGLGDLKGLSDYFNIPSVQASSTIVVDGEGFSARLMSDSAKPWTQSSYNSVSLSIENIGYAATDKEDWFENYHNQLATDAKQFAYWSEEHGIPLRRAITISGGVQRTGVATHKQLGQYGGGHVDPGNGYPLKYVIWLARYHKLKAIAPKSRKFRKAKRQVNRIRKHYGIRQLR